jgi:hypothetical protein
MSANEYTISAGSNPFKKTSQELLVIVFTASTNLSIDMGFSNKAIYL